MSLFSLALFFSFAAQAAPTIGGEGGNGGQQVALEFSTFGADVTSLLEQNFRPGLSACADEDFGYLCSLDLSALRGAVRTARVVALPELTQEDPVTGKITSYSALNFPQDQRILVSEADWQKPSFCYVEKLPMVLHEYLGLLGVEVQNYRYSSLLSAWFQKNASDDRFNGCPDLRNKGN